MNKKLLLAGAIAGCMALAYAAEKDPIVMTVGDIEVPRSEFEYLYNKNARQQIGKQTIDEYAGMFELYKMKVADALAAGIDTTKEFINEFRGYRSELAAPYLVDSVMINQFVDEEYGRLSEEVEAIHIMLFKSRDYRENRKLQARIDSIKDVIENHGGDFADLARRFSQDRGSSLKGGNMGFIQAAMYPYLFETACYTLAEGELQTVESPQGYHLIKGGKHRASRGTILAQHILCAVADTASSQEKAKIKNLADSLYVLASSGADFDDLARRFSDDPGSVRSGGRLNWFGPGQMVPEFEKTAYDLSVGEVSKPVRTRFGWHIIKKLDVKGVPSLEEVKPRLLQAVTAQGDVRGKMVYNSFVEKTAKKYNYRDYPENETPLIEYAQQNGVDSLFFDRFLYTPAEADKLLVTLADKQFTVGDFAKTIIRYNNTTNREAAGLFVTNRLEGWKQGKVFQHENSQLEAQYPEFRSLVNEYRDGMLLFEISNRKVWEKASQDTEGLEKYFLEHKGEYTWKAPRGKCRLIQAENDSVAREINEAVKGLSVDDAVSLIRKDFGKVAKVDLLLAEKGENPYVDHLLFGEAPVNTANSKYHVYYMLGEGKIIAAPEEVNDVRGAVTTDYQNELEKAWIEELKAKYPVKVNRKELKKIKENK